MQRLGYIEVEVRAGLAVVWLPTAVRLLVRHQPAHGAENAVAVHRDVRLGLGEKLDAVSRQRRVGSLVAPAPISKSAARAKVAQQPVVALLQIILCLGLEGRRALCRL